MQPRKTHLLASAPDEKFIDELGHGLKHLFEHVSHLQRSVELLAIAEEPRGVATVRAIADEEAAKYLILVDAIRCDRKDQSALTSQLRRCHNRLAKGI